MKCFQRIAAGIDVLPLAHALQRKPYLWGAEPMRTRLVNSPHAEVEDILLRFEDVPPDLAARASQGGPEAWAEFEACPLAFRPAWTDLPEAKPLVQGLMVRVGAYELGRVVITKLKPGGTIYPHADTGLYSETPDRSRYHLVLRSVAGSNFHCGAETVHMAPGELWWFDAQAPHSVQNNGNDDRLHLLIDVRVMP